MRGTLGDGEGGLMSGSVAQGAQRGGGAAEIGCERPGMSERVECLAVLAGGTQDFLQRLPQRRSVGEIFEVADRGLELLGFGKLGELLLDPFGKLKLFVERGDRTAGFVRAAQRPHAAFDCGQRSEEHTSELQSLMRISNAVVCLT